MGYWQEQEKGQYDWRRVSSEARGGGVGVGGHPGHLKEGIAGCAGDFAKAVCVFT